MVELDGRSALVPIDPTIANLCGSDYDRHLTVAHHRGGHRYAVSQDILDADVVISLPKLKA